MSGTALVRGKYAPLARLATGGMAEILLARLEGAQGFEKLVVLKRLLPHLAEEQRHVSMFLDEARTVARISHPNVCEVYELGEEHGRYTIVMEYLEGVTAGRVTSTLPPQKGRFELRLCAELLRQACEGLHHAHELRALDGTQAGLVHRDISPQNLLVTVDGVVKVLDFGIAKTSWSTTRTRVGSVMGKTAYMSPEQVRGWRVDRKSDLFSLGVVMHEMLVGQRLFRRDNDFLTYRAITDADAADVRTYQPDLPAALAEAVRAALARDAEGRPATARELGERIVAAVTPLGGPLRPSEVAEWMTTQFGGELGERRALVVAAVQRRARAVRLAGYDESRTDDLPTVPLDTEIDPPRLQPVVAGAPRPVRLASDSDVLDAPAGMLQPKRAREVTATPRLASAVGAIAARTAAEESASAPARPPPGRARLAWLAVGAIAASVALAFAWGGRGEPGAGSPLLVAEQAVAADAAAVPSVAAAAAGILVESLHASDASPEPEETADAPGGIVVELLDAADAMPEPPVDTADAPAPVPTPSMPPGPAPQRDRRPGWLTVDSRPYATVFVDGKNVGLTPVLRLSLAPGLHRVRAVTADGQQQRFRVVIEPGREAPRRRLVW